MNKLITMLITSVAVPELDAAPAPSKMLNLGELTKCHKLKQSLTFPIQF
jgi:hypothetical protein